LTFGNMIMFPCRPVGIKTNVNFTSFGIDRFVDGVYTHIPIYVYLTLWD